MNNRRNFLGKLSLGITGVFAMPMLGFGRSKKEELEMHAPKESIKKNKADGLSVGNTRSFFILCPS